MDVTEALEKALFAHYCQAVRSHEPHFDAAEFTFAYNADLAPSATPRCSAFSCGWRTVTASTQYLAHLPRIWGYLQRNLRHVTLAPLAAWYDKHFPVSVRDGKLPL